MPKSFLVVNGAQSVTTAGKSTIINSSQVNAYLTEPETDIELDKLPIEAKQAVLNTLYRIKPGESRKPASGTYNLSFDYGYNLSAVIVTE